jgi:hypothetical protein
MVIIHISKESIHYEFIIRMLYLNEVRSLSRLNSTKYKLSYNIR